MHAQGPHAPEHVSTDLASVANVTNGARGNSRAGLASGSPDRAEIIRSSADRCGSNLLAELIANSLPSGENAMAPIRPFDTSHVARSWPRAGRAATIVISSEPANAVNRTSHAQGLRPGRSLA